MTRPFRRLFSQSRIVSTPLTMATDERRLVHNVAYSVAGQVGYVIAQIAVLSALANFKGVEAVGEFGLALAVTTPLFMLANMGVRTSQASDVKTRYLFSEYAGLVLLAGLVATALSIGIGYAISATQGTFLIVLIISIAKAFEAISTLSYGAFQQAGRTDKVASSLFLRGSLTVAVFVTLLSMGVDTGFAFLAQLVVWGALAIAYDYPRACRISSGTWVWPAWRRDRMFQLMRETAPIGAGHFMNGLLTSLPRLFVDRILGLEAVGLFTVVGYFQQAATLVVNAISQALVNWIARFRNDDKSNALWNALFALVGAAVLISASGIVFVHYFGEAMLGLLFGPEFQKVSDVLMLITLAVCAKLFGVVPQSLIHADRRFRAYFWYQAASLAVCIGLLSVCVPLWGLLGAGYTVLAVALFRLIVLTLATVVHRRGGVSPAVATPVQPETEPA